MKLLYCPRCEDIVKATMLKTRTCECGASGARYLKNGISAEFFGLAVPLGIAISSLGSAVARQPEHGPGVRFDAFVIEKKCPSIRRITEVVAKRRKPAIG